MNRLGRWLVLGVVAMSGVALAQDTPPPSEPSDSSQMGQGGSGQLDAKTRQMVGNLPVPQDEQSLVNHLHHINQMEIELAQLAQQKATSNEVRQFAQMLIKEHQSADQKLTQWAKKKQLTVGEVQPANDVERKKMDMAQATRDFLQTVEGQPFDQQFLTGQVAMHDMAIGMVTAAQQQFARSDIAPLLKENLTSLKKHRARAYKLLGQQSAARQARTPPPGR